MNQLITLLLSSALLIMLISTNANALPPNAHAVGNGWKCNTGYKRQGQQCNRQAQKIVSTRPELTKSDSLGKKINSHNALKFYIKKDYKNSFRLYLPLAKEGDAEAQHIMGEMYYFGRGVLTDKKIAATWFQKAGLQGRILSQSNLGNMYRNGDGVPQDYKKSAYWYQKAATQGHVGSQYVLGLQYKIGQGVLRDDKKSVHWYQKASAQGHTGSQLLLGVSYCEGTGVAKNLRQCANWIKKAHENGDTKASGIWDMFELWKHQ